ncbi:MAG: transglycosylase domain-containing protein [Candidatus Levybacteria bacterium]|nr:transglycosylase domain-containing protein [Candidatus Levybacteria bacterium]
MYDYRPSRRRRSRLRGRSTVNVKEIFFLSKLSKYAFFAVIALVLAIPVMFIWYSRDLPTPGKIVESKYSDATRIYDRTGKVILYSVYEEQNRTYVKLDQIPDNLRNATIAIEDEDFYKNKGFSPVAYLRVVKNALLGRGLAGGSTISQQLVKNVLLTNERNLPRKIKELILSIQVNHRFSKDQILELYLNNIPYGGTAIGVEAAAQQYFGKDVKDLDLVESAFLAGLPQSPTSYSPFTGNKHYVDRTRAVLMQMVSNEYITKEESEDALKKIEEYKFSQRATSIKAPHYVMYVRELLVREFGENMVLTGGLQVITTLDYALQKEAEEIVKDEIGALKGFKVGNGAAMVTDPKTGEILAMVGSKDYFDEENDGNFNVAVSGERQPGSSLKPIIYAKSFEKGYTPATLLMDVQTEFPTDDPTHPIYIPVNYSGKFSGPVQVRFALGNSINLPAVKMLAMVGIKDAMQKAYEMGIEEWEPTSENLRNVGLSLVLGGRETTLFEEMTAYGVFANKGMRQDLKAILNVKDSKGKTLFETKATHSTSSLRENSGRAGQAEGTKVLSDEVAFLTSHILLDNNARIQEFGANSYLRIPGKTVAVKTGTTDEKRDNWTVGYTPSIVVGVWVGNNDRTPMNPKIASGATGASTIWHKLMRLALKDKNDEQFTVPENVEAVQVDAFSGGQPVDGQPTRTEYFIKGTQPTTRSPILQREFFVFKENDPVSTDGRNRWQEGIDAWIEQAHKDDPKYHPPEDVKNPKKDEEDNNDEPTPTPTEPPTP